ncbi:aprataxin-like protein [Sitodiplosis mosellana]|uniref:aprataxin-like protein n=1 Tax=Sitodiplosis mosellana TaxID=263140 RepID=UPI00244470F3|nr:aprataxin-like protein [Sitodiplosis mosellana]
MAQRQHFHWSHGLLVELANPRGWILQSKNAVVIPDKFPKAMYHFLVLPKENIPSIFELRKDDLGLLNEMYSMALNIIKVNGRETDEFKIGYHAEPSLLQLHLHVISTDFHSPTLKTDRHWNSFNTKLFIPHHELVGRIIFQGRILKMDPLLVNALRQTPLKCHRCRTAPEKIQDLKSHLMLHLKCATVATEVFMITKMGSWSLGLLNTMKDPNNWIISNKEAIVMVDKFPKAEFHFLVLPKENIPNIFQLSKDHLNLLNEMYLLAQNVIEIKGKQLDEFKIGYHAEPSMQQVHLHVISTDFNSPALKTKKHWNSFTTEFFVPHEDLVKQIEVNGKVSKLNADVAKDLLSTPLKCHRCDAKPKTIPDLKAHILQHLK